MSNEAWVDFGAGWFSGGVSVLACQPIDTVLTRIQANITCVRANSFAVASATASSAAGVSGAAPGAASALHSAGVFRGMIKQFGVVSLWRGSSAMIGAVPVQNALLMSGYGAGKRWSEEHAPNDILLGVFIGGCTGGILQSFLMSPVELIKVTQQVIGKSAASATSSVAQGIFSRTGAWKGLRATLLRDSVPHGVWFVSYEYAKGGLSQQRSPDATDAASFSIEAIATPMLSGAFAATTAWLVGYPFDLIKTRIQAGSGKGIIATGKDLVNDSGGRVISGLYKGFTLKLCRAIPASAIQFLVYETAASAISGS